MEWIQSLKGLKLGGDTKRTSRKQQPETSLESFGTRRRKSSLSSSLRSKLRWSFGSGGAGQQPSKKSTLQRRNSFSADEWKKESEFEAKLRQERYQALGDNGDKRSVRCRSQIIGDGQQLTEHPQEEDALMPMRQELLQLQHQRKGERERERQTHVHKLATKTPPPTAISLYPLSNKWCNI